MDGMNFKFSWKFCRKRTLLRHILFVCLSLSGISARADILLLLSSDVGYYRETAKSLTTTAIDLGLPKKQFNVVSLQQWQQWQQHQHHGDDGQPYELIVAIGTAAANAALQQQSDIPLLNIFMPRNAFESLHAAEQQTSRKVSAIYLDQPLKRLITLSCLLKPEAKNFGTIFGPISKNNQPEIERLTNENGILLSYDFLSDEDNPVATLKPIVADSELFIAIPDHAILNRAIARWILYLSFQQKIPVIGFSHAYTNAGAVASVFSSPENIGIHAAELIADWLTGGSQQIWTPQYPRYFTLSTNPAVARSLDITLPREKELYEKFREKEAMNHD
jgi:putative ABC transport system substrate-binding protein